MGTGLWAIGCSLLGLGVWSKSCKGSRGVEEFVVVATGAAAEAPSLAQQNQGCHRLCRVPAPRAVGGLLAAVAGLLTSLVPTSFLCRFCELPRGTTVSTYVK